jgi:hypothetical protein
MYANGMRTKPIRLNWSAYSSLTCQFHQKASIQTLFLLQAIRYVTEVTQAIYLSDKGHRVG